MDGEERLTLALGRGAADARLVGSVFLFLGLGGCVLAQTALSRYGQLRMPLSGLTLIG